MQRRFEGRLVQRHFDRLAAHGRVAQDRDDTSGRSKKGANRGGEGRREHGMAQIVNFIHFGGELSRSDDLPSSMDPEHDDAGPDRLEQLPRQRIGNHCILGQHVARRAFENERRRVSRTQTIAKPIISKGGDGRDIDGDDRGGDEGDDENHDAAGETAAPPAPSHAATAPSSRSGALTLCSDRHPIAHRGVLPEPPW